MRTILDFMAAVSFVGVLSIGIGGAYVYSNRDGIIEEVKRQVTEQVKDAVTESIGGVGGGMTGGLTGSETAGPSLPGLPF